MIVRQHKSSHKKKVTLTQFGTALLTQLSESCTAGVANCPCVRRKQEAPLQMTPAAACLKRHSCEICLSNYLLDLEPKMPKHFSSILSYFFSNERSGGLHCYSWVSLLSVFFVQEETGSSM